MKIEGRRNQILFAVALAMRPAFEDRDEDWRRAVFEINEKTIEPPLTDNEVCRIVVSARKQHAQTSPSIVHRSEVADRQRREIDELRRRQATERLVRYAGSERWVIAHPSSTPSPAEPTGDPVLCWTTDTGAVVCWATDTHDVRELPE